MGILRDLEDTFEVGTLELIKRTLFDKLLKDSYKLYVNEYRSRFRVFSEVIQRTQIPGTNEASPLYVKRIFNTSCKLFAEVRPYELIYVFGLTKMECLSLLKSDYVIKDEENPRTKYIQWNDEHIVPTVKSTIDFLQQDMPTVSEYMLVRFNELKAEVLLPTETYEVTSRPNVDGYSFFDYQLITEKQILSAHITMHSSFWKEYYEYVKQNLIKILYESIE